MAMIQWFPGHMHLTRQALAARLKATDVVVELLDARLPASSANPMLAGMIRGKPTLKILNKQDLADPQRTAQWLAHYNAQPDTRALALQANTPGPARLLIQACQALAPQRGGLAKPLRVLMCGIPNVGKSTLINTLVGRRAAKAADEPGVTRAEQRILLADDFYLYDTPGVLWPRIIVAQTGYNLAASGAVGRNAFDEQEVVYELLAYVRQHYPAALAARYGLAAADVSGLTDEALFAAIGRACGALQAGGAVHAQKTAERVLDDFRSGRLGAITLETPQEFAAWLAEGKQLDAERQLRKDTLAQAGHIRPRPAAARPAAPRGTASKSPRKPDARR